MAKRKRRHIWSVQSSDRRLKYYSQGKDRSDGAVYVAAGQSRFVEVSCGKVRSVKAVKASRVMLRLCEDWQGSHGELSFGLAWYGEVWQLWRAAISYGRERRGSYGSIRQRMAKRGR